jgi:hypothetical protein
MTDLSHQDLKDVLLVLGRALECSEIEDMRREVLACLENILHCDRSTFFLANRRTFKELDYTSCLTRGIESIWLNLNHKGFIRG